MTTPEPTTTAVPVTYFLSSQKISDASYASQVEKCALDGGSPVVLSSNEIIEDFMNSDIMSGKFEGFSNYHYR